MRERERERVSVCVRENNTTNIQTSSSDEAKKKDEHDASPGLCYILPVLGSPQHL